jgi:hypothetical protein
VGARVTDGELYDVLRQTGGDVKATASLLGLTEGTVVRRRQALTGRLPRAKCRNVGALWVSAQPSKQELFPPQWLEQTADLVRQLGVSEVWRRMHRLLLLWRQDEYERQRIAYTTGKSAWTPERLAAEKQRIEDMEIYGDD